MSPLERVLACSLVLAAVSALVAGEVPAPAPGGSKPPRAVEAPPPSKIPEEERWVFEPPIGDRTDIFVDREIEIDLLKRAETKGKTDEPGLLPPLNDDRTTPQQHRDAALELIRRESLKVEGLIVARKWDETIKVCDNALKALARYRETDAEIRKDCERFERFRAQAVEAKDYEEAQTAFESLDLRIEGILWSPGGSLAVINGEPRARGINERVKDCTIINIDTDRVDFLFHYNRKRFEFQRYVGDRKTR